MALILPAGTQVVIRDGLIDEIGQVICPAGAVGVVIAAPPDQNSPYLIRFPKGFETSIYRHQLTVSKHFQQDWLARAGSSVLANVNLFESIIYRCITGSRAYGLDEEGSDTDIRRIYQLPSFYNGRSILFPSSLRIRSPRNVVGNWRSSSCWLCAPIQTY